MKAAIVGIAIVFSSLIQANTSFIGAPHALIKYNTHSLSLKDYGERIRSNEEAKALCEIER